MGTAKVRLTAAETQRRERVVSETIHAHQVEGIAIDEDMRAQFASYVAGELSADEVVEWAQRSVGLSA